VFRRWYPRITTGGFPHSEILGSTLDQQLPEAYRSRPRPSSAPDAKASTVCPCSLDFFQVENTTNRSGVFKVRAGETPPTLRGTIEAPRESGANDGLSKLNSLDSSSRLENASVDVIPGEPFIWTAGCHHSEGRPQLGASTVCIP
jgi:hypothetical protein